MEGILTTFLIFTRELQNQETYGFPLKEKNAWHGSKQKYARHDEYSLRIKERK